MEARRKRFLHLRAERSGSGGNAGRKPQAVFAQHVCFGRNRRRGDQHGRRTDLAGRQIHIWKQQRGHQLPDVGRPARQSGALPCGREGISGAPVVLRKPEGPHKRQAFHGAAQGGRRIPRRRPQIPDRLGIPV